MTTSRVLTVLAVLGATSGAVAQIGPLTGVEAELRPLSYRVPQGQPVLARFTIANNTNQPVTLTVPGIPPSIPSPQAGLPLDHVFSSGATSGVSVATASGRRADEPTGFHIGSEVPLLMIAPHGSVGATIDLREYYPALRGAGQFRVTWEPYAGAIGSKTVVITVAPMKRVEIVTDVGSLAIRLFYSDAPNHVANFMDLVESDFYDGKVFHRVEPGYLLQGGCPRGDGTGIRPDGKRVVAEFNGHQVRKGSVAMALLDDDPDSASCQFFICNTRQKDWDGRYTVFGELADEASFETLSRLMNTAADESGHPLEAVYIRTARLVDAPLDDLP